MQGSFSSNFVNCTENRLTGCLCPWSITKCGLWNRRIHSANTHGKPGIIFAVMKSEACKYQMRRIYSFLHVHRPLKWSLSIPEDVVHGQGGSSSQCPLKKIIKNKTIATKYENCKDSVGISACDNALARPWNPQKHRLL